MSLRGMRPPLRPPLTLPPPVPGGTAASNCVPMMQHASVTSLTREVGEFEEFPGRLLAGRGRR
eukprot:1356149-Prorocentrum_lima.AAC.1